MICLMSVLNIRGAKEDNVNSDLQSAADGGVKKMKRAGRTDEFMPV